MPNGPSIHDMIENALAETEGRMASDDQEFEKAASAEETVQRGFEGLEVEEIFKYADALEAIGENLTLDPKLAAAFKTAAKGSTKSKVVPGGGQHPTVTEAEGGKQAVGTASASQQVKDGPLESRTPGSTPTHTHVTEAPDGRYGNLQKLSSREALRERIMAKIGAAGDGQGVHLGMDANISSTPMTNTTMKSSKAGEGKVTGEPGESLITSNEGAINYTKRDAKKHVIPQLKKYLKERALSAKTDNVLQTAWKRTGQAGAKIASAGGGSDVRAKLLAMVANRSRS